MTFQSHLTPSRLAATVLAPFSGCYFLSYLYRTVNAVLGPHISADIALDAASLGLMTGMYLLAFGSFQFPLGILLDRFGPRRVEAALLLFAAGGAALFAVAEDAAMLIIGRGLIGLGVSACLMGAIKANVQFYPPDKLPLVNGIILFSGGLGAVAATIPVQAALAFTDWRGVFLILAAATAFMSAVLFMVVPDKPGNAASSSILLQLREASAICKHQDFIRIAPFGASALGAFMAVQGLWAGPWLRDVAGLDSDGVAQGLMAAAGGMAAGYLVWGAATERLQRLGIPIAVAAWIGMSGFAAITFAMAFGWKAAPDFLCFAFGFLGASSSLCYVLAPQMFPPQMAGRAATSLNLLIFAAAFACQWGLGAIIDLWPKTHVGWPPAAYMAAFLVPAAVMTFSALWMLPLVVKSWRNR